MAFISGTSITFFAFQIKINGNETFLGPHQNIPSTTGDIYANHSALAYFNGTTDYAEAFIYSNGSGLNIRSGGTYPAKPGCYFSGVMVRTA